MEFNWSLINAHYIIVNNKKNAIDEPVSACILDTEPWTYHY